MAGMQAMSKFYTFKRKMRQSVQLLALFLKFHETMAANGIFFPIKINIR